MTIRFIFNGQLIKIIYDRVFTFYNNCFFWVQYDIITQHIFTMDHNIFWVSKTAKFLKLN